MKNIEYILNDCLNKAMCQKNRIQNPNSNNIADFVSKYLQTEKLTLTDVGFSLPTKEAFIPKLETTVEEKHQRILDVFGKKN
tara:strand:+ start:612 stop:857 length:246 start_codon:yes stop_codon:yes gene_type:complete